MKTLVSRKNGLSLYIFNDDVYVEPNSAQVNVGEPLEFSIADCNAFNAALHENVTPPEDWAGCKYLFDGATWTLNPNWVDPASVSLSSAQGS